MITLTFSSSKLLFLFKRFNFKFFKYTKRKVFLSVRRDNNIASKFYLKNDMRLVGEHNWAKNGVKDALPGDVYLYDKNVEITMETK